MGAIPAVRQIDRPAPAIDVLTIRAQCRAYLWWIGDLDLPTAVDQLEVYAQVSGLTRKIGDDACQQIIANAFAPYRREVCDA